MAAGLWWQRALGVLVVCWAPCAQAAPGARLVVVPSLRTQSTQEVVAFAETLQKPLADVAVVLPTAAYTEAAQRSLMGAHLASGSAGAVLLGTQVGASHALYLRATTEQVAYGRKRKRTRQRATLWATLVDVTSGATVLSQRYPTGTSGLGGDELVAKVVVDVRDALAQSQLPAASPAAAVPPAAVAQASGRSGTPTSPAAASAAPAPDAAPVARAAHPEPHAAAPGAAVAPTAGQEAADPYAVAIAGEKKAQGPDMQLGLRGQLGLMVFTRQSTLSALGVPKLQYGVSPKGKSPAFAKGSLQLEAFPLQLVRRHKPRAWYEGIGVHIGGAIGAAKTRTSAAASASSLLSGLRAGLTLRHLFGSSPRSPELALRVSYARVGFAMPPSALYPSLSYSGVSLALGAIVPLGTPRVSLVAEAALLPALHVGNQGALLGVHRGGGVGAWAEAGLKITPIRHLDILALFDWEHYNANFVGSTLLPNSTQQYASVSLRELLLGGRLAVGTTF